MIALIKQELNEFFMGEDNEEVFFSLEDDVPVASSKPMKAASVAEEEETKNLEDVEILDAEIIMQATGDYAVEWPLIGMDCPDCASKATKALNFMPQVSAPVVSATSGEVKLSINLEKATFGSIECTSLARPCSRYGTSSSQRHQGSECCKTEQYNTSRIEEVVSIATWRS